MTAHLVVLGVVLAFGQGPTMPSLSEEVFETGPYREAAIAASTGDRAKLRALVKAGLDLGQQSGQFRSECGPDTMPLLVWAVLNGSKAGVEELLRLGADPNQGTANGYTPLMGALTRNEDGLVKLLIEKYRVDPNRLLDCGKPPGYSALVMVLGDAEEMGGLAYARAALLLKHDADVNQDLGNGEGAALYFAMVQRWREVHWLLSRGARVEERNGTGLSVIGILCTSYERDLPLKRGSDAWRYRDKVREYLVAHGVDRARVDHRLQPDGKCKYEKAP